MANVLIRDVSAGVHDELRRRANRQGQSLQQYLHGVLVDAVSEPLIEDWISAAAAGASATFEADEIAALVRADRDDRS